MSTKYKEFIEGLSREALSGIISDEDQRILHNEIETNPIATEIWQKAVEDYNSQDVQQQLNHLQLDPLILAEIEERQIEIKRKTRRMVMAAAIFLLLVTGGISWLLTSQHNSPERFHNLQADLYKDEIYLKTDDNTVAIKGDSTFKVGNVLLSNKNGILKYSSVNGTSSTSRLNQLIVPVGKIIKMALDDGSVITLNSKTTIRFPFVFDKSNRTIYLSSGEAFLEVATDKRPFTVRLPDNNEVQVLGTSFNVNTYQQKNTAVSLVTGKIKVSSSKETLTLLPGRQAVINNLKITEEPFDPATALAWKEGLFYFSSFAEVVDIVDRWYGYTIVFDSKTASDKGIRGGINQKDPLDVTLRRIQKVTDKEYHYEGKTIHFK